MSGGCQALASPSGRCTLWARGGIRSQPAAALAAAPRGPLDGRAAVAAEILHILPSAATAARRASPSEGPARRPRSFVLAHARSIGAEGAGVESLRGVGLTGGLLVQTTGTSKRFKTGRFFFRFGQSGCTANSVFLQFVENQC